jgi:hypothetical protein
MKAVIHYHRINKPETLYTETLVSDDGVRVDTISRPAADFAREWSVNVWQRFGALKENQVIATVRKHIYYQEWFSIMELRNADEDLLGFYCDILTPLENRGGEYYLLDLLLDLWISPDGSLMELDWDEFELAARDGLLTVEQQRRAADTLVTITEEARAGRFPWSHLPPESFQSRPNPIEEDLD